MDLTFGTAFQAHAFPPPTHDSAVEIVGMMNVPSEDHRAILCAECTGKPLQYGKDRQSPASERGRMRIEKEILHVDDHQGALLWVECHGVCIEGFDVFQPEFCLAGKRAGSYIRIHRHLPVYPEVLNPPFSRRVGFHSYSLVEDYTGLQKNPHI